MILSSPFAKIGNCGDTDARVAFLEAYQEPHNLLLTNYGQGIYTYVQHYHMGDDLMQVSHAECKFKPNHFLVDIKTQVVNKQSKATVKTVAPLIEGSNSRYSFTVGREQEGSYVLRKVDLVTSNQPTATLAILAPFSDYLLNRTYLELANDPQVEVVSWADADFNGTRAKELVLVVPTGGAASQPNQRLKRTYYFSPERRWLCVGQHKHFADEAEPRYIEDVYEYETAGQFPRLRAIKTTIRNKRSAAFRQHIDYEITSFVPGHDLPDELFRLSAFNLPEPTGVSWHRPTPWWLWLIGSAFALLLVAAGFMWLKRRALRSRAASA
jgi:hypothetical protein